MTPNWISFLALMPLVLLLMLIARKDVNSHTIPNRLVLIGSILGVGLNTLLPSGFGFNNVVTGGLGWIAGMQGLGVGLAVFIPLYWLRVMGAGDVKLMAMVGAFLGPNDILSVVLATFIAGGIMALVLVLRSRQFGQMLHNIKLILLGGMVKMSAGQIPLMNDLPVSVGKLPYAVAIAAGTFGFLVWQRLG